MARIALKSSYGAQNLGVKGYGIHTGHNALATRTSPATAGEGRTGANNGGVLGGIGYVGHKFGLGVLSTLEGIWDYSAGGIAKLFGADEWAEEQFANDWVNYNSADEWYDPSEGWKFAGDVAGGLGTSAVSIATAFIPGVGPGLSIAVAGLGAAGNATKEAYRETGTLGGKEFAYGALVGGTEALLEKVTGKLGMGSQRIASEIAERMGRSSAKEITKTVGKVSAKKVLGQIGKDFAGEAFEEGMAEILSPFYKNLTYSEGETIDWKSVGYNALVGGISGVVMGGGQQGANTALNYRRGNKAVNTGSVSEILAESRRIYDDEIGADVSLGIEGDASAKGTGNALFAAVRENYEALQETLKETNGEVRTAKQKMLVGALQQQNVAARLSIFVEKSAANIVRNASNMAARAESFGLTDENGAPVSFTVEELTEGVDLSDLNSKAGQKRFWRSLRKAMVKNPVLSKLAVMDATGHLLIDTQKFAAAEQSALRLAEQTDLNQFLERADAKEKAALAERLGIEDFNMLSHESFRAAVAEMFEDGATMRDVAKQNQRLKQALSAENAAVLPETVTAELADGVYRTDVQGNGLSVLKEGDNFFVVQPTTRKISRALGVEELTSTLQGVRNEVAAEGRLALKKDASGKTYVSVDSTKIDASQSPKQIISALSDVVRTKFTDFVQVNGQKIGINQRAAKEWVASRDASALMRMDNQKFLDKANAFENADEILQAARDYIGEARKHTRKDNFVEFARGVVTFEVEGRGYDADVIVGTTKSGVALLYDLVNIQDKKITTGESDTAQDRRHETPAADISITENAKKSNSFAEKNSANDANSDTSANLEGTTPPPQAVPRPSQGADGKSEQGAVQKSAQEGEDNGKARREAIAIDVWARENIPDYAGLNAPARAAVRATVRNARAHGISNEEVLVYARVAARSGLSIAFDVAQAQAGDARYNMRNTIFVDPNAPASRRRSKLLLHEGGHALFLRTKSGRKLMEQAFRLCDPETAKQVREDYTKYYEKQGLTKEQYEPIIEEEIAAAGLESALGVDGAWEFILSKRPTAGEKLLSFFRGAARDYAGVGELSAEARKLLRTYQKAFAELSAYNQGNNALTGINGENVAKNGHNVPQNGQNVPQNGKTVTESGNNVIETKKAADDGGRLAVANGKQRTYSYNELVRKGDLTGIVVKKGQQISFKSNGTIDSTAVIDAVKNKCEALTTARAGTVYYVEVPDIGKRVEITRTGIEHGYHEGLRKSRKAAFDKAKINARVALELPQLLKNSIEVNISDRSDNLDVPYSHVMMGTVALEDSNGVLEYYAVRSVIEERVNQNPVLAEMNVLGKLHAANAKKIGPPNGRGGNTVALTVADAYTYSIADFLQNVKGVFDDTFSLDVYQHLGVSRAVNDFSKNMRFALPKDTKSATAAGRVDVHAAKREQQASAKTEDAAREAKPQDREIKAIRDLLQELKKDSAGKSEGHNRLIAHIESKIETAVSVSDLDEIRWQIENITKIEEDSKRLNAVNDEVQEAALIEEIVTKIKADAKTEQGTTPPPLTRSSVPRNGRTDTAKTSQSEQAARKSVDTITMSKGQLAALQANYHGDKVFAKKDVAAALKGIDAFKQLPAEIRNEFVNRLWTGYNKRLHAQGFAQFTEVMWHQLHATIMQEVGYDEFGDMTEERYAEAERVMDEQIVAALDQIVASGKPSIKHKLENATSTEGYRQQANYWREEHSRVVERNKLLGRVKFEVEKLANQKAGRYLNAAQYRGDSFRVAITELAKMNWRGGLVRDAKIREHFATLDAWYSKDNPLYKGDGGGNELFRQDIKDALNALGNARNGALTTDDLLAAESVIKYFAHEIEAHNTVYKNGKRVDAMPLAKEYVAKIGRAAEISGRGLFTRSGFARLTADPALLMRQADGYLDGFFTEQFEELRRGTIDAAVTERELAEEFEKFWSEHEQYGKRYNSATVTFDGKEMPLQEAISLYMTMKREHAHAGLAGAGFEIEGKRATQSISEGFADEIEKIKAEEYKKLPPEELLTLTNEGHARIEQIALKRAIEKKSAALEKQFTAEDKALIAVMERGLEAARKIKVRIDEIIQGYSNVTGGYYFPIRRTGLAENVDAFTGFEGDRVSNLSINKDTVKNAHKLLIEPVHVVYMRHLKAISLYEGLGVFTDNFNRLFNLNVTDNANNPLTVRTELSRSNNYTKEMLTYFKELKQDVEGISKKRNTERFYNDAVAYIRSTYATYQLGFNPKVWVTQLSSFVAATNMLDADCLARGLAVSGKDVDEYCRLAWLRNNDNAAAMAQAVSTPQNAVQRAGRGVLQKIRGASTWMIGKMDRVVVRKLFAACQVQVEKNGGAKVGTKENKVAAGEMLTRVILETQQNSLMTERSAAMRSGDELLKGSTMFSADAMKITARVVEADGKLRALRYLYKEAKKAGRTTEAQSLQKQIKRAKKQQARAMSAFVGVALFNAALAYAFKWLYRRDEEEDAGTFLADTFGNMLGGIPFVRDAWGLFYDGYEADHFMLATFNDVVGAVSDSYTLLQKAADGEEITRQQTLAHMRKLLYAAGQLTGVPVRNIYNVSTGLINRVSPETGYKVDSLFYQKNYRNDLQKALEAEDEERAAFLLGLVMEETSDAVPQTVRDEMLSLLKQNYGVLPRATPKSYTKNGETVELDAEQQARIAASYAQIPAALDKLFGSAGYQRLSAAQRADAIGYLYDLYRAEALTSATGEEFRTARERVAGIIGQNTYVMYCVATKGITSDVDKNGETVAGSKRKKVVQAISSLPSVSVEQRLLLICASGYSLQDGDVRGLSATGAKRRLLRYILSRPISAAEKAKIAEMCGFEVKNGRIRASSVG